MDKIADRFRYARALIRIVTADGMRNRAAFWLFAIMMFANNVVYFTMWAIYFYNFSSLRGWELADFATLQGICCFGFGLTFFFCGGAFNIARQITSGELDSHLGKPRAPLLPLLLGERRPSALGDVASAFVFWMIFAKHGLGDLPLLVLMSLAAAALFLAVMIIVQSLAFWMRGIDTAAWSVFEVFLTLALYPQKAYPQAFQFVLFTIIPAAYIGFLPVEIMRHFSWPMLAGVVVAGVFYLWLAIAIFNRGLRSYTSGNIMQR